MSARAITRARAGARTIEGMTIAQVARATNTTAHTLRYYERIGLIRSIRRAGSGHRRYGEDDVRWVEFLRKMHATGMPIRKMLAYATLQRQGDRTIPERRLLLEDHGAEVVRAIGELQAHLAAIEAKVRMYQEKERSARRAG